MRKILSFGLIIIILAACKETRKQLPEMQFVINHDLLQEPVKDDKLAMGFCPPLQWNILSDSMQTVMKAAFAGKKSVQIEPREIFADSSYKNILFVCSLGENEKLDSLYHESFMNDTNTWTQREKMDYYHNEYVVSQYLLQNQGMVNYKLVFSKDNQYLFQMDYIVQRPINEATLKAIESSIGTVSGI